MFIEQIIFDHVQYKQAAIRNEYNISTITAVTVVMVACLWPPAQGRIMMSGNHPGNTLQLTSLLEIGNYVHDQEMMGNAYRIACINIL